MSPLFFSLYILRERVSRISSPFLVLVWHVPSPRYHSRTPGVELWVSRATSLLLDLFFPSGTLVPSSGRLVHSRSNRFFIHSPYLSFPSPALFLFSTSLVQSLSLFFCLKSCTSTPLPLAIYLPTYLYLPEFSLFPYLSIVVVRFIRRGSLAAARYRPT